MEIHTQRGREREQADGPDRASDGMMINRAKYKAAMQ